MRKLAHSGGMEATATAAKFSARQRVKAEFPTTRSTIVRVVTIQTVSDTEITGTIKIHGYALPVTFTPAELAEKVAKAAKQ